VPRRRRILVAGLTAAACVLGVTVYAAADRPATPLATFTGGSGSLAAAPDDDPAAAGADTPASAPPAGTAAGEPARIEPLAAPDPAEVAAAAPASITHLRQRYGVPADEAARRLALQQTAGELADRLAGQFPAEYGGMWLDQAAGGVLTIAATDPDRIRPALAGLPDADRIRVVPVAHPLSRLGAAAAELASALGVLAGTDVVVDQPGNTLVVLTGDAVPAGDARLTGAIAAAGVPVTTRPRVAAGSVPKACDPRYCDQPPMRGGIRLDVPRNDGTVGGCTSGFNLRSGSTGARYLLTAGHCVIGARHTHRNELWHQYLGPRRPVTIEDTNAGLAENAFPNDYAIMPFQAGAEGFWFPTTPGRKPTWSDATVNYWPPGATRGKTIRITGLATPAQVQVGWVVCATGSGYTPAAGEQYVDSGAGAGYTPGTRCGTVNSVTSTINVRICARFGDSGGPLFTEADGKALGILSNGDPGSGACTNADEQNQYVPVSAILDRANSRTGGALDLKLATTAPRLPPPPRG
jgi:streptogrisin C